MALLLAAGAGGSEPVLDTTGHPELDPMAAARVASRPPLAEDDVIAMHRFLEGWAGDLRTLLDRGGATGEGDSR